MLRLNEWNPVIIDIAVILILLSLILYILALCFKEKFRKFSNHRYIRMVNRSMAFYVGMALTIFVNFINEHGHLGQPSSDLYWSSVSVSPAFRTSLTSLSSINKSNKKLMEDAEKVIFITTTRYSLVQPAILTKIGQALFPVRDHVIWIVVSTTNIYDFGILDPDMDKNESSSLMSTHLQSVEKTLKRFGVPYVLLESHAYFKNQFMGFRFPMEITKGVKGLQTGVIWVLQNFKNGVLMLGHEEYTYNYHIFNEVRKTKVASSWPVGLGKRLGFSSPIVNKGSLNVKGYHDGANVDWHDVLMELGAFALNIKYLRQKVNPDKVWKITWDGSYKLGELGIGLDDIEPLGENATKILVWRTQTKKHAWPKKLNVKKYYNKTNMIKLMKNVFGLRYPSIKMNFNFTEKTYTKYY